MTLLGNDGGSDGKAAVREYGAAENLPDVGLGHP